jgi:two-component system, OmpR family, response regulator
LPENRILLVEDEPTTREIVTHLLRGAGYALDAVGSAGAATTCLETVAYALVIVDWFLPDGNGAEVADAAAERGSKALVISDFVFQIPGRAVGGHELLSKRLASTEIVAAVHRMIGKPIGPERRAVYE